MAFRIMLAGGGTGGHVYPLVAIAEEVKRLAPRYQQHVQLRLIGDGKLMADTGRELSVSFVRVVAPKWRRYFSVYNILDLFKIPVGFLQACWHVWSWMPDVMLVKGGYAAFLPALAARLLFVPLVVHESDSVPGAVNRWWGRHARRVFLSFEHARRYFREDVSEVVGNPIRPELLAPIDREAALAVFNLSSDKPIVFVNGGSQGSKAINETLELARFELEKTFSIIHSADGSFDVQRMRAAYAASDVIVSRAGSALFEIAAAGKPAIIVPLPDSAQDHQVKNAEEFAEHGGIIISQSNLTPHILISEIKGAYVARSPLGGKIKAFARPDAARTIAEELLQAAS